MLTDTIKLENYAQKEAEKSRHINELEQKILEGMEWFLIDLSIADMHWDRFMQGDVDLLRYAHMESLAEFTS